MTETDMTGVTNGIMPSWQAVTGTCLYVDNGMHAMGLSLDSSNFKEYIDKQSGDPWDGWKPDVYLKNI